MKLSETFYPRLREFIGSLDYSGLPLERIEKLQVLEDALWEKLSAGKKVNPVFICTHNSRRSLLAQVWCETAARNFDFGSVRAFSGGTMVTAMHPDVVQVLQDSGFRIRKVEVGSNPVFRVSAGNDGSIMECFSKKFDHPANPDKGFIAIMTCQDAEENCPFIPGAELRVSLNYEDPGVADGRGNAFDTYKERNRQIACEMFYLFFNLYKKQPGAV